MKSNKNLFHFKGIKEEMETPEERKKRLQMEFKKEYNDYMKKAVNQVIYDEINEFVNRPTE